MTLASHQVADCGSSHDLEGLIAYAQAQTHLKGERFTPLRHDTLRALAQAVRPISAYDLLGLMNKVRSRKISAMSVYRALDYLRGLGVVVKIESNGCYMLCYHPHHAHAHLIIVCSTCGMTHDVHGHAIKKSLQKLIQSYHVVLQHDVLEMRGVCEPCQRSSCNKPTC